MRVLGFCHARQIVGVLAYDAPVPEGRAPSPVPAWHCTMQPVRRDRDWSTAALQGTEFMAGRGAYMPAAAVAIRGVVLDARVPRHGPDVNLNLWHSSEYKRTWRLTLRPYARGMTVQKLCLLVSIPERRATPAPEENAREGCSRAGLIRTIEERLGTLSPQGD